VGGARWAKILEHDEFPNVSGVCIARLKKKSYVKIKDDFSN